MQHKTWEELLRSNQRDYTNGYFIAYNYAIGPLNGFGNIKHVSDGIYPSEIDLITTIKTSIKNETEVDFDDIRICIISVTEMSIDKFKDFIQNQ